MINEKQKIVIKEANTPAAVIAGPGTGKTFTIVKKVVDLVKNEGIPANKILITTFTKKAAAELNRRIVEEFKKEGINSSLKDLKIGNFHSLANIYLDKYRIANGKFVKPEVIDSYMEAYLIKKNIDRFNALAGFKKEFAYNPPRKVQEVFESITNNLIDINTLKESDNPKDRLSYEVYMTHLNLLDDLNLMNFQMILKNFYDLLANPATGDEIRNGIDYVIIDEYQDTNFIQQEIAFKLVRDKNIMVFGDDDQSLYSFRGADPKNLTGFSKVSKRHLGREANFYKLNINYRSNQTIIDLANDWMDTDEMAKDNEKILMAFDELKNENTVVRARADKFDNIYKIIKILNKSIRLNQIAFLFPSFANPYPKDLQAYLEKRGIPVINYSTSQFFNRKEIRILVYIFAKIYGSYPSNLDQIPYMSYEDMKKLDYRRYIASLFDDQGFKSTEMDEFIEACWNNPKTSLSEILYKSFKLPVLKDILDKKIDSLENERALSNISTFTILVSDYENIFDKDDPSFYLEFIYGYLYYFYSQKAIKEYEDLSKDYDALNFMTIHSSKGLEFDVVFMSGLNDNPREEYPRILREYEVKHTGKSSKYEDFYRKYYTAMTRAKNLLVLLDNSRDIRLRDFAGRLNDSSVLSTIDFKLKEDKKEKPILAFTTDIEVYMACPLRYKFIRKLDFKTPKTKALIYGSLVHDLAEYMASNDDRPQALNKFINNNPKLKIPIDNFLGRDFKVSSSESNYKAERDFYIIQGNIDINLEDGSIVDLKTGGYDEKILEKYKNQVLTYKYLKELNNEKALNLYLYFLEKDELIKVENKDFSLNFIDEIAENIVADNIYEKTDDLEECKFCPMKYYCDRY